MILPCLHFTELTAQVYNWTTIAGEAGSIGSANGTGRDARFWNPSGVAVGPEASLYISDTRNCTVRKLTPAGSDWIVSTIAGAPGQVGSANGTNTDARFNRPNQLCLANDGSLYVVDHYNHTIRRMEQVGADWAVSTIAGSPGKSGNDDGMDDAGLFFSPTGIAADAGGTLYVSDTQNNGVRGVSQEGSSWAVSTLAGWTGDFYGDFADGYGYDARFQLPGFITADSSTNLFVADWGNHAIRQMTFDGTDWLVTTIAGWTNSGSADGVGIEARFNYPNGIVADSTGALYVADQDNHTIRKLVRADTNWMVSTIGGMAQQPGTTDGFGTAALFRKPWGIAVDAKGTLYVADFGNQTIRKGVPLAELPPKLQIAVLEGTVIVSWPAPSDYALETAPTLSAGTIWTAVPPPPVVNGNYTFTQSPGPQPAFYRLRK
jgi:sugar lactone lactonase YvrE